MALQFTIVDQFGVSTIIDEPVGWDGITLHYIRHKDWHGFIDTVDDTMGSLQFYGDGYSILSNAFANGGVEAPCGFIVEYQCADDGSWDTIYQGRFSFYKYKEVQGLNGCYAECSIESITNVMVLKNRYEQKVDLNSLVPFQTPSPFDPNSGTVIQVISMTLTPPPDPGLVTVNAGDSYIVPPAGGWPDGNPDDVATFDSNSGTFLYTVPTTGQVIIDLSSQIGYIYDGTAWVTYAYDLPQYNALGALMTLPAKPITLTTSSSVSLPTDFPPPNGSSTTDAMFHFTTNSGGNSSHSFTIEFDSGSPEVNDFSAVTDHWDNTNLIGANNNQIPNATPVLTYSPTENYVGSSLSIDIDVYFDLYSETDLHTQDANGNEQYTYSSSTALNISSMNVLVCTGQGDYHSAFQHNSLTATGTGSGRILYNRFYNGGSSSSGVLTDIHYAQTFDNIPISQGENVYVVFWLEFSGTNTCCVAPHGNLTLNLITGFQPTLAPVYMINESLSRVSEAITTDQIRVYSDFFGRTDSQPYDTKNITASGQPAIGDNSDGEGSMLCITNGLLIRGQLLPDGAVPPMPVSLKQLFEALNAVYNIGMCIEADPTRSGYYWLRVEPMEHFYSPGPLIDTTTSMQMLLDNVDEISIELQDEKYVGVFKTGYSRWEGEQTGGLDDFMNKRDYRTSLSCAKNVLEKYCDFIGSSYAIETTRRQSGLDAQDWRFDHENFFICTERPTPSRPMVGSYLSVTNSGTTYTSTFTITDVGAGYSSPPVYYVYDSVGNIIARGTIPLDSSVDSYGTTVITSPGFAAAPYTFTQTNNIGFPSSGGFYLKIFPPDPSTGTISSPDLTANLLGETVQSISIGTGTYDGFTIPPLVALGAPTGSPAVQATAIALLTDGTLSGFQIINPGNGYISPPTVTLTLPTLQLFQVEQYSINNAANIVSPTSVYNYRISPARNAMRWLKSIFQSYAQWMYGVLYFVAGEANIKASGQYAGLTGIVPVMENAPIAENQNLSYNNFTTTTGYAPLFTNQLVKFTYPLSYAQWQSITANPYGLISYSVNGGNKLYGWIEELKYSPFEGTADFVIKPQIS